MNHYTKVSTQYNTKHAESDIKLILFINHFLTNVGLILKAADCLSRKFYT